MPPTRHAFSTNQETLQNEDFVQTTSANNLWEDNSHLEHSKPAESSFTNSPSTLRAQPTTTPFFQDNMTLSANPNSFNIPPSHPPSEPQQPSNPSFHLFPTSNFDSQGSASSSFLSGTSPWSNDKTSYDLFGASHPFSEVFGFPESSSRRGSEASIEESFNSIGRSRRGSNSSVDSERLEQPLSRRGSLSSDPWGPSSRTSTPGPQPAPLSVNSYNFANEHGLNGNTLSHINALTAAYTGLGSDSRRGSLGSDLDFEFGGHDYPSKVVRVPSSNQRSSTASPSIEEDMFGMEPFDPQYINGFANLSLNSSNSGMEGSSSPTPFMYDGTHPAPGSTMEHPLGEHPSRTLFVRNIDSNVEDDELSALFEQYGPKRSMYTQCKHRGFVMISYYDIRHAKNAMKHLQGKLLKRRKLDIHYSIPKDNPSEKDLNQGTLVVFNLDPSITNDELKNIFGVYGEIKEIRETPNKKHHKFIEFYDIRDAERAMKNLNKTEIRGKKIKIEPSRPGGARKTLLQQGMVSMSNPGSYEMSSFPNSFEDELENLPTALLNADQDSLFSNTAILSGARSDPGSAFNNPSSPGFSSSSPSYAQQHSNVSRGFSSPGLATSPLNPLTQSKSTGSINFQSSSSTGMSPIGTPLQGSSTMGGSPSYSSGFNTSMSSSNSSYGFSVANNNNMGPTQQDINAMPANSYRNAVTKSRSSTIPFSPTTQSPSNSPPRSQGFISPRTVKSPLMWNGPPVQNPPQNNTPPTSGFVGSPLERHTPVTEGSSPKNHSEISAQRRRSDSIEDKTKFSLNLIRVRNGDDKRTTLMIRNIPNKYNQKMLLSTVDETHKGTYDFFYLPIDFKNKCNVGYAFINFINCQTIISFYENFNNKKWEKFNSEKVCEIAYARIQGKHALIGHFQNSSLMVEDKKCRPMIFYSDGPNMGEAEPFPVGTNVRRRGSLGGRDDKPTNLNFSEYPLKNE